MYLTIKKLWIYFVAYTIMPWMAMCWMMEYIIKDFLDDSKMINNPPCPRCINIWSDGQTDRKHYPDEHIRCWNVLSGLYEEPIQPKPLPYKNELEVLRLTAIEVENYLSYMGDDIPDDAIDKLEYISVLVSEWRHYFPKETK